MANWAYSVYKIKGSEEEVAALYKTIQDLADMDESLLPNGFGKLWLGNLVHALGGDWNDIYCRGHILDYSLENGILKINTETAWGEMSDVRHFIEQKYPSLQIFFQTEECGMCIFQTNDATGEVFPERWLLDWNDEKENVFIWEYFTNLPAVIQHLKDNGVIEKDIQPTKEAIVAVLSEIEEERPDDISWMLEEFVVVDD